jgi:hypothetical protein
MQPKLFEGSVKGDTEKCNTAGYTDENMIGFPKDLLEMAIEAGNKKAVQSISEFELKNKKNQDMEGGLGI